MFTKILKKGKGIWSVHGIRLFYIVFTVLNVVLGGIRLIETLSWSDVFKGIELSVSGFGELINSLAADTIIQILVVHLAYQIFLVALFVLIPFAYYKVKSVKFGGAALEMDEASILNNENDMSYVFSRVRYVSKFVDSSNLLRQRKLALDSNSLSEYVIQAVEECLENLYSPFGKQLRVEPVNEANYSGSMKNLKEKEMIRGNLKSDPKTQTLHYYRLNDLITYQEEVFICILTKDNLNEVDEQLFNGLLNQCLVVYNLAFTERLLLAETANK